MKRVRFYGSGILLVKLLQLTFTNSLQMIQQENKLRNIYGENMYCCVGGAYFIFSWRGHTETVTSIALIDHKELIVTSSLDCTARVWTHEGQYVGTFGQTDNWDLSDDLTWSHPFIPDDVLVDPTSVPNIVKDEPEEFTRKANPKNENESESQQWLNEVREALKTSNGKRLKIQRHLSKQPKEVAVDPASNAFR